jgi:glycosyltransferase involved in cell wall biosynthesis
MRIGVDLTCLANDRGYGRFTRELIPAMMALAPDDMFVCFADDMAAERFTPSHDNVELIRVPQSKAPAVAAAASGYRSPMDMWRLTRSVSRTRIDVFFSPSVYSYFPLPFGLPAVVTVHDAIAERFPEYTLTSPRARLFWRLKVWLALKQSRLVLTISDFAAEDIAKVLGIPRTRIRVTSEAPAAAYQPSPSPTVTAEAVRAMGLDPDDRWFVYLGGFNPHKHVDRLIEAHARVAKQVDHAPKLLLVGSVSRDVFHNDHERLTAAVEREGTGDLVRWMGYQPDDQARWLHAGAVATVLPSAAEGFGLPAVEAAACGTPVIATTESPLPRLLDGGGIFVPPGDVDAIAAAMLRLLEDAPLRKAMSRAALDRARALTWEASALTVLAAIREAAR